MTYITIIGMFISTVVALGLGVLLGSVIGIASRLWFQYSFTQYCAQELAGVERVIQARRHAMLAKANEEVAHIYREAADYAHRQNRGLN